MSDSRPKIIVAEAFSDEAMSQLADAGDVTQLEDCDEGSLRRAVVDADALVVRTQSRVTRAVVEAATKLKVIGRGGVGLDNIDLVAVRERGIAVVYTPHAATEAVADLAVGMMVSLVRRFGWAEGMLREGQFAAARGEACAKEMRDLILGVVGMGRIGQAVARRCRNGFGMSVVYNDIREIGWLDFCAESVSKDVLYQRADIVTLHVPLTDATHRLIDSAVLAKLRRGAILINTSRGPVVDNVALAEALNAGQIGGAGLDVFDPEPLPSDHPLLSCANTVLTPHLGARTDRGLYGMNNVVEDVVRVLNGQCPCYAHVL